MGIVIKKNVVIIIRVIVAYYN